MCAQLQPLVVRPKVGGPVVVGSGLLAEFSEWVPKTATGFFLVADQLVFSLYGQQVLSVLRELGPVRWGLVPSGEQSKTRGVKRALEDQALEFRLDREGVVLGLGGGVTTDLSGFLAATYLRGVAHLALPTSLVGMVDAALGGKTGLDTRYGKNLVGAFHLPVAVVADTATLNTLPEENLQDGFAEMLKHGAALDARHFRFLVSRAEALWARDRDVVLRAVSESAALKLSVVDQDPRESGRRRVLNFGHTVGHALEQVSRWSLSHGRAVGAGMWAEARCAHKMGLLGPGDLEELEAGLHRFGLKWFPEMDVDRLIEAMLWDKKNRAQEIRMALPKALGCIHEAEGAWAVAVDPDMVREVLAELP